MSNCLVDEKLRKRVLRLLAKGPAQCEPAAGSDKLLLENDKGERIGVDTAALAALAREGLISRNSRTVRLSPEGQAAARREVSVADPFQGQHRELDTVIIDTALVSGVSTNDVRRQHLWHRFEVVI